MVPRSWVIPIVIQSDKDYNEIIFTPSCLLWLFETEISKHYRLALGIVSSHQTRSPGCALPGGTRVQKNGLLCRPNCRGAAQLVGGCGHTVLSWCSSPQDHGLAIKDLSPIRPEAVLFHHFSIKHLSQSSALNHLSDPVTFCRWYNRAG